MASMNMSVTALWCRKRDEKGKRGNQTKGKEKVLTCQATTLERHYASSSRAYKHRGYAPWMEKTRIKPMVQR